MICDLAGVPRPRFLTATRPTIVGGLPHGDGARPGGRRTPLPAGGMMMAAHFDQELPDNALPDFGITPSSIGRHDIGRPRVVPPNRLLLIHISG